MIRTEFDQAMSYLIAVSSGHWATLDALVKKANHGVNISKNGMGWLKTIYLRNVRDAMVTVTEGNAKDGGLRDLYFERLLKLAILGIRVHPFSPLEEGDEESRSLVDLAYERIVLNRFPGTPRKKGHSTRME